MKGAFLKRTLTSRSLSRARLSALFWNKTSVHLTACSRPASTQTNSLLLEISWEKIRFQREMMENMIYVGMSSGNVGSGHIMMEFKYLVY